MTLRTRSAQVLSTARLPVRTLDHLRCDTLQSDLFVVLVAGHGTPHSCLDAARCDVLTLLCECVLSGTVLLVAPSCGACSLASTPLEHKREPLPFLHCALLTLVEERDFTRVASRSPLCCHTRKHELETSCSVLHEQLPGDRPEEAGSCVLLQCQKALVRISSISIDE